jgi:hypothetical protein
MRPNRPSPLETIGVLGPVGESLTTAHVAIDASIERINQAKALVGYVLQGAQPGPMLTRLDALGQVLRAIAERGNIAKRNVESALAQARKTGDSGKSLMGAGVLEQGSTAPGPPPVPGWISQAAAKLPQRSGGKGPVQGLLLDVSGRPVPGAPFTTGSGLLRSGAVPEARDGIRSSWHALAQATREHVEAHAAAILRKPGSPQQAALVINKATCVSRGEYVGCDEVLPGMLPRGKRLTVYVTNGQQTRLLKVYEGTGEGIAP